MSTLQKMLSEIRELDITEWDHVGGMGEYGPTNNPSIQPSNCVVASYTEPNGTYHSISGQDDANTDAGSD